MPVLATMTCESRLRLKNWFANGCNAFETENPVSQPIAFWTEQDVLEYIVTRNLKMAEVYGTVINRGGKLATSGKKRTGCVFCLFGIMYEKDRIAKLQKEEPVLADYVLRGGEFGDDGYRKPSGEGLGYWFVIDWLNLHGPGIFYEDAEKYRSAYGNAETEKILSGNSG